MADIIDGDEPACVNFFQHACGNFEKFRNGEIYEEEAESEDLSYGSDEPDVEPFLYNKQDYFNFFTTHKHKFRTIPGILVRNAYDLCKLTEKHKNGKRRKWLHMINGTQFLRHDHDLLRKWPFLQYQWLKYHQQLDLNWPSLVAEFIAHGLNTFFKVFFAENTIYVTPNEDLQCPQLEVLKSSLLPLLKQRNHQIADIIATEIWVLCRQLKGEIALSEEIDKNSTNLLLDNQMNELLQRLYSRLNLTDLDLSKTQTILIDLDKLSEHMALLSYTNPRIIYNFILWQSYEHLIDKDQQDCFSLVQEFEDLLLVEYWNWYAFNPHFKRDVALASYLFHTTRFQRHYRQFITASSVDRLFQQRSERKDLNIERSIKNYAKQFLNIERYNAIYKFQFSKQEMSNSFSYILEMRRLKLRFNFLNPLEDFEEDLNFFKEFINFSILLIYRPRLHYFASYDLEMWHNSAILQNSDGFYASLDCLSHQTSLHKEDSDLFQDLSTDQVSDIFNFYTAFNEALADYKFWLESENFAIAEDFILEYFKLDSYRVVYYAAAQQYCGRNNFAHSSLINRSFMNMPEFQDAFQCTADDEMNPMTKCMINRCLLS